MSDPTSKAAGTSRRGFLKTTAPGGAGLVAGAGAAAAEGDPLITKVQDWASGFGDPAGRCHGRLLRQWRGLA